MLFRLAKVFTIERTSMAFTDRAPSRNRCVLLLPTMVTWSSITESRMRLAFFPGF